MSKRQKIFLIIIALMSFSVSAENLHIHYNYQSTNSVVKSGDDFLYKAELQILSNGIIITSEDGQTIKAKTLISKIPYQISYHVEGNSVTIHDDINSFSVIAPNSLVVDDPPFKGVLAFHPWFADKHQTAIFANAPIILNQVKAALIAYLGTNSYKITKSYDLEKGSFCSTNDNDIMVCRNTFLAIYHVETTDNGNLTCEKCNKPDSLDKMNGNILKITNKIAKDVDAKTKDPAGAVASGKTEDVKKEAQKIYTLGSIGPGGGKVFFVDGSGMHGLETTAADEPNAEGWAASAAAARARGPGWRLPTVEELKLLWQNREAVKGSLYNVFYWSSTEDGNRAYTIGFPYQSFLKDRAENKLTKGGRRTRPVREF